jgi:hypothetical protein
MWRAEASLGDLQEWFQAAIVASPSRAPSVDRCEIERRVTRSLGLTSGERLDIYSQAYFSRLHDCLADDYPAVRHLLGEERFERLVRAYLTRHPSRHYSLNALGRELPGFLAGSLQVPRRALLSDVARLELAMSVVFDAPKVKGLGPAELAAVPREAFPEAAFELVPAFALLELGHRANEIVSAVRQERPLPPLGRKKTWVAVYRKDYVLWRKDVDRSEFRLLSALKSGVSLEQALGSLPRRRGSDLAGWVWRTFADWRAEGVFAKIALRGVHRTRDST